MEPKPVYRAPMRARSVDAGSYPGARFGVANSLTGTGEPLSRAPVDLEEALVLSEEEHGAKSARMLERFAGLQDGTLVWTRTAEDEFRLGSLTGGWRYDESSEALRIGICQVRPTRWISDIFSHLTAPDAVGHTFSRGGRNFQRIRDPDTEERSSSLWNGAVG